MTTPALLDTCGTALHGHQWQRALARDLGVSERTVRYWCAGRAVPDGVWAEIGQLLHKRGAQCRELAKSLERRG